MFHLRSDLAGIFGNIANDKLSIETIAVPLAADLHATTIANPQIHLSDRVRHRSQSCSPLVAAVEGTGSDRHNRSNSAAISPTSVST
jgi:hypothetical protein